MTCSMQKMWLCELGKENDSTPIYFLSWCYFVLGYGQEFWYILSGLKYLSVPKMKIMNQACQILVQVCRNDKSYTFFPVDLYELVVDCHACDCRWVKLQFVLCAFNFHSVLKLSQVPWPSWEELSPSWNWHTRFSIAALSILFFSQFLSVAI